uniref:Uncharacterized protein LOC111125935 isoform X1 n=1 Tax=Crassostrea virginica TaxID=6565 RepID=A0A8B8DD15_CRAVI|nr:uncharacterized protein LOC111125935 isoform X1 [Crassostrea virginica]
MEKRVMADFVPVVFAVVLVSVPSSAVQSTLTFEDDNCGGPYYPRPWESFKVTHTGGKRSNICKDMTFSGWDDVGRVSREVCVKVTEFKLECSQTLEYRAGTNRGNPDKSYDCKDKKGTILEEFCTFEVLYVRLKLEEPLKNTFVEYTVRSGATKDKGIDSVSTVAIMAPILIIFSLMFIIGFVYCIYKNRVRQHQGPGGAVLYNPTQIPQVNVQHHYTLVGQNQPQGQSYPLQRYSEPPQQVQTYPPQGYNAPPQQAQTYTQPSAPVAYPYPRGQEVYPPKTATSAHQHSSDTGEPPSYDEVTKQKK